MAKIAIVGMGVVGKSVYKEMESLDHDIIGHDIKYENLEYGLWFYDFTFLCLPTPTKMDDLQDVSSLKEWLNLLNKLEYQKNIIIKSTILPNIARDLLQAFPNLKITFSPEFLSSHNPYNYEFPIILGSDRVEWQVEVAGLFNNERVFQFVTPEEACFIKYFHNCLGSAKVALFSHFFEQSQKCGFNYYKAIKALEEIGHEDKDYWQPFRDGKLGFGGSCFIKDTAAWNGAYKSEIFKGILKENERWRNGK